MLPYVHGKVRSRRAYRPNAVTALSAALLSVFALFAAFRLLHAPQHHIAERQPYDAKDDDQLVQEAVRVFCWLPVKTALPSTRLLAKMDCQEDFC